MSRHFRRIAVTGILSAIAAIGILWVMHPQRVQALGTITVTVIGTITDPAGVPYAGGTIDATLIPTGVTPTVPNLNGTPCGTGGCQITGYIQPVSINTDGTFAIVVYCNTGCSAPISPSGTQWLFTVRNKGTQPPAGYGGISFTVTETINTNGSQDIGADLRAAAPRLLVSAAAGAGPVTGSGTTGFIPLWSSTTQLGNSSCDDSITTALTVTCTHNIATSGNVTLGGGTVFTNTVESSTAQGNDLDVFCDSTVSCHMNVGSNNANENTSISGGSIASNAISGATLSNGSGGLIGGLKGGGTLNAEGLFVQGVAPVQLAAAGVNITPVTAAANTTGFQNLQTVAYTAGIENAVGKSFRVHAGGTLAVVTGGAVKAQIAINIQTVQATNISSFSPAATGTYSWSADFTCTVLTTGPSGSMICDGTENFGGVSGVPAQLDNATFPFTKTISANLQTDTGPLLQAQFSTGSTSNTMTSNVMSLEFLN